MIKLPDFLEQTNYEEVTREELYRSVEAYVGDCHRTSLEFENISICRVDKGSCCNEILGFWVFESNSPTKFYVVRGLTGLEKWKTSK